MKAWILPMLRAATLLSLVLLWSSLVPCDSKRRKGAQATNMRKRECETTVCEDASDDDRNNCVLECQSPECYEKVYAADELEPGEIDNKRSREFNLCLQNEMREQNARARQRAVGRTEAQRQGGPSEGATPDTARPVADEAGPAPARADAVEL